MYYICPSISPSLSEYISSLITMIFYHINVNTYYLWLPQFQGHLSNFKVIEAKSLLKHVKFGVSGEHMGGMS